MFADEKVLLIILYVIIKNFLSDKGILGERSLAAIVVGKGGVD